MTSDASTTPATTTGQIARRLGLHPDQVTQLISRSRVLYDAYPLRGGKRVIPAADVEVIAAEARRRGLLPPAAKGAVDAR